MEVEVIKAKRNLTDRSKGKKIDRMRVAACSCVLPGKYRFRRSVT